MTKIVITLDRTMTVKLFRVMQCSRGTGRKIGSILSPIRPSSQEFQDTKWPFVSQTWNVSPMTDFRNKYLVFISMFTRDSRFGEYGLEGILKQRPGI